MTASQLCPRFLLALAPLALFGGSVLMRTGNPPAPHRYFSAFAMLGRATCGQGIERFIPNALQHDGYGDGYLFECNPRGFTIVSAGADGRFDTADDTRSDR